MPCFVEVISWPSKKERDIKIIDRSAPRVAIQITEIAVDAKKKDPPAAIRRALDRDESLRRGSKKNHC
jgi:hypothetical protein